MNKIIMIVLISLISVNGYAEDEVSQTDLEKNVKTCSVNVSDLNDNYNLFSKKLQKVLSVTENTSWFMAPERANLYSNGEKVSKLYYSFKKNTPTTEQITNSCEGEDIIALIAKYDIKYDSMLNAIQTTENQKDKILQSHRCVNLNNYTCNMYLYKNYMDLLSK